jgi:GT2 family glycosyltransferase
MDEKKMFIVIPVHNRKDFTRKCLLSLQEQTYNNFRAIVVDDGSTDGTSRMIEEEFHRVVLLKGGGDLWWAGATNLGIQYALDHNARYVMTLNDDTVATKDFIEKMVAWSERKPQALLGALAIDIESGKPVFGGERINWKKANAIALLNVLKKEDQHGLHEVTHFPGRGLLIPSEVFHKIGLFDALRFPQYAADYDFTHRAIRSGYAIFCNYDAKLLINPDASGDVQNRKKRGIRNYYNHLFRIKGGGNLRVFFKYVMRNCPRRHRPWYIVRGITQRILGYWL